MMIALMEQDLWENGYALMGLCFWMWGLEFCLINVHKIENIVHFNPVNENVSSCSLEPNELRELVVQHINPNLQQSSNGYVMMVFCL
jgi:hypothetical protein